MVPLSTPAWNNNNYSKHFGTQLTYRINYNFDSIQTIRYLEKKYGHITDYNVDEVINEYHDLLIEHVSAIKLKINEYSTLNIDGSQIYTSLPYVTFYSKKKISNFFQLEEDYRNLLSHRLVDSLTVSSLYSRPPIQIEDPGGGIPSNPYTMFYIKQTVNDTLLNTGLGIKIGILETFWESVYSMVDPSITYFKSGNVTHDSNIEFNSYAPHATTVAVLSSGHHGIAKDSKIYSSSFKRNYPTDYTIGQALSWLSQKSSSNYDNIDVDIINMSFTSSSPIQEIRDFTYLNRKIMISGAGNNYTEQVGYPAAFPNVFSVGATNQSGDSIWMNTNIPETGSSYISNSNGIDKPNIVAPGMVSFPNLPYSGNFVQGTSFSSPLVAGAVAKLIEARPYFKLYPELVYAY